MHEIDDALPGTDMLVLVEARAARRDAALAAHVGRFGDDEARPADGAAAQMHQMPVAGRAVVGRVLAHRRHDDAVGYRQSAQPERREHRRRAGGRARLRGEAGIHARDEGRIA
jgi:hypothetical protein